MMKAKHLGKQTWHSSLIELTVALIVLSTLGNHMIEGTVDGAPGAAIMIVLVWVAFIANRGRLAGLAAAIAAGPFVLYTLTAGCTLKGCLPGHQWNVGLEASAQVVGICIDDGCSRSPLPITTVEDDWVMDTSMVTSEPGPKPTIRVRVTSGVTGNEGVFLFDVPGKGFSDRSYKLRIETADGQVVSRKVRPARSYCNGKRCGDPLLDFDFIV
jgi:hypothetical protein